MRIAKDNNTQRGVSYSGCDYVDNAKLLEEIMKSQTVKAPTVALCLMVRQIIDGVLQHRCFNRYPPDFKDDMASESFWRILRGLVNTYDTTREKAFGYVSHACFLNFMQQIMKRYKRIEREQLASATMALADMQHETSGATMNGKPLPNLKKE